MFIICLCNITTDGGVGVVHKVISITYQVYTSKKLFNIYYYMGSYKSIKHIPRRISSSAWFQIKFHTARASTRPRQQNQITKVLPIFQVSVEGSLHISDPKMQS